MEGGGAAAAAAAAVSSEKQAETASYTYWVREVTQDAAPLPVPKKLTPDDLSKQSNHTSTHLGSAWNRVPLFSFARASFFFLVCYPNFLVFRILLIRKQNQNIFLRGKSNCFEGKKFIISDLNL